MTQGNITGNRLVLPNRKNPADPKNNIVIERWAQNHTVNKIIAGSGVSIQTVSQAQGAGAEGTGVITISASGGGGGYASLTGAGETTTPGALTQDGGFTVNDAAGDSISMTTTDTLTLSSSLNMVLDASGFVSDLLMQAGNDVDIQSINGGMQLQAGGGHMDIYGDSGITLHGVDGVGTPEPITLTGSVIDLVGHSGIVLNDNSSTGITLDATAGPILIETNPGAGVTIKDTGTGGIVIEGTGAGTVQMLQASNPGAGGVLIGAPNGALITIESFSTSPGAGVMIEGHPTERIGFYGTTPIQQPVAGSTLGVYAAGVALGLWS